MVKSRVMTVSDTQELQAALDIDTFHPGVWTVDSFLDNGSDYFEVFEDEDEDGVIAFVRYHVESDIQVRIFTVWRRFEDTKRNALTIVFGINQLVERLRGSQFTEIILATANPKLASFCMKVLGFESAGGDDYVRQVKE